MKNNRISISLFRVSPDSKYLDMIFDCPNTYYFTSLILEVRSFNSNVKKFISQFFDLSNALFVSNNRSIIQQKHWVVRLPLEKLGINYPAIYKATFKIESITSSDQYSEFSCDPELNVYINKYGYKELSDRCKAKARNRTDLNFDINTKILTNEHGEIHDSQYTYVCDDSEGILTIYETDLPEFIPCIQESLDCDCLRENCLEDHAICSDVNQAYKCMLDELMMLEGECFEISDELIRKYLLLYGHQSALSIGDYETAERYFKLITNCFDICSNTHGCKCCDSLEVSSDNSCNCRKS